MTSKEEIQAWKKRWEAVEEFERQELMSTPIELRWRQINAVIGLAIGLGILEYDPSEEEVYQRWATLRNKTVNQPLQS